MSEPNHGQIAEVQRLYKAGYSYPRIARRTGVPEQQCREICSPIPRTWNESGTAPPLTREVGKCPSCGRMFRRPTAGWPCAECRALDAKHESQSGASGEGKIQ